MKSEMNALKQRLNTKPPLPKGFPTGRTIPLAGQIATHLGNAFPEGARGHLHGVLTSLCSDKAQKIAVKDFSRLTIRLLSGKITQLQQTNGQWREQPKQ